MNVINLSILPAAAPLNGSRNSDPPPIADDDEVILISTSDGILIPFASITDRDLLHLLKSKPNKLRIIKKDRSTMEPLPKSLSLNQATIPTSYANHLPPGFNDGGQIVMTGIPLIDDSLYSLCPRLINRSPEELSRIGQLVDAYFVGQRKLLSEITAMTNEQAAAFIQSAKTCAWMETDGDVSELEAHLRADADTSFLRSYCP